MKETTQHKNSKQKKQCVASNCSNSSLVSEYLIIVHPDQSEKFTLRVCGPVGKSVILEPQALPDGIAVLSIMPNGGVVPFITHIEILVLRDVPAGVYKWRLDLKDVYEKRVLDSAIINLVVLPVQLTKELFRELRALYEYYGVQIALWQALRIAYPHGATFSTLKTLYEVIATSKISKGSVGNILHVLSMKGLVEKVEEGFYKPVEVSLEDAIARVDIKRVRGKHRDSSKQESSVKVAQLNALPDKVQEAYYIGTMINQQHGSLPALYFLMYTLLGARKTGFLLLWKRDWFIICEPKTHLCHHYHSIVLNNLLNSLGLLEGIYYPVSREHEESRKIAERYIHQYYGGYKEARRLHYMLRDEGYISQLDDKPYTLKIYHYKDGTIGVDIYDYAWRDLKLKLNVEEKLVVNIEVWIALPMMHISKKSEEVYFDFK